MGLIVDPGSGLVDGVDSAVLAGATGVHARFSTVYNLVNGNIDSANVDTTSIATLAGVQTFTGAKTFNDIAGATFSGTTILPSGAVPTSDRAISINSGVPELYNNTTSHADVLHREDGYNETIYDGGNINLGTSVDGSFVDADATNAKIDFTVNVPGRYKVEFDFSNQIGLNSSLNAVISMYFRLTDGTVNSLGLNSAFQINAGGVPLIGRPISIYNVFNFATTGSKTVKLQKRIFSSANVSSNLLLANNSVGHGLTMRAYRISN